MTLMVIGAYHHDELNTPAELRIALHVKFIVDDCDQNIMKMSADQNIMMMNAES